MATFILVPGAMYSAWVWHPIVPLLEAAGHTVLAPDLPGTGENRSITPLEATLEIWSDYLVGIAKMAAAPILLVGHSRGGHVIGEVAERIPDQIACLVYVTAALSTPGQTMFETISAGQAEIMAAPMAPAYQMPDEYAETRLFERCEPGLRKEAIRRLFPEPLKPAKTRSGVSWSRWGSVLRAYIECSDDKSLTLDCQRAMQEKAPCGIVLTIDADHSPFLSEPRALADALLEVDRRLKESPDGQRDA